MLQGAEALAEWMARRKLLQGELAELLQVHKATVSQWLCGAQRPQLTDRMVIQRLTGISVDSWLTPREVSVLEAKLARVDRLAKTRSSPDDIFNRLAGRVKVAS
jgi:transcriptional regulator with XRE-family HTH domain